MDLRRTALEIGLFETALNLEAAGGLPWQAGAAMPLPAPGVPRKVEAVVDWLLTFAKRKYLFLTPEIALIEAMASKAKEGTEAVVLIPCDMPTDSQERLCQNLPGGMSVGVREEPYFPKEFIPANGLIVVCGYLAGGYAMVMNETYRLLEHYGSFTGRIVFIPYVGLERFERYAGWSDASNKLFADIWGEGQ